VSPATSVVADTQVLIWYVIDPDRLTAAAAGTLDAATDADLPIYVSAYSLVELVYAVEKAANPLTEDDRQAILEELTRNDTPFEVMPVTAALANRVAGVPRNATADPGDRIIAATAEELGVPLVSADRHMPSTCRTPVVW
jgi:PIN domain nuclease of toxin-antitoxin system